MSYRLVFLLALISVFNSRAQVSQAAVSKSSGLWIESLSRMSAPSTPIGRSNAIPVILQNYQPDTILRGIVFLPSVADQFYLLERGQPLQVTGSNLWDLVSALTNQTTVRMTFLEPFLVLHTAGEHLTPDIRVKHRASATQLQHSSRWPDLLLIDQHWERLQPQLAQRWQRKVTPAKTSEDAWHFGRHNVVGAHLTDWQLLQGLVLAGHTTATIHRQSIAFSQARN